MYVFICTAALDYLKAHPVGPVDSEEFSVACGVGVLVTAEQIQQQVRTISHVALMHTYTLQVYGTMQTCENNTVYMWYTVHIARCACVLVMHPAL